MKPTKAPATKTKTAPTPKPVTKYLPHLIFFQGRNKQWYFHLKAANNEIIFQSEGYKQKASAIKGVKAIHKCLNIAVQSL